MRGSSEDGAEWDHVLRVLEEDARRGGSGRKLQALDARVETREKICERRRCWRGTS